MADQTPMLSIKDVAKRLGCDYTHVLSLIDRGDLIAVNIAANPRGKKRRLVIDPIDFERFIESRRTQAPAPHIPRPRRNYVRLI